MPHQASVRPCEWADLSSRSQWSSGSSGEVSALRKLLPRLPSLWHGISPQALATLYSRNISVFVPDPAPSWLPDLWLRSEAGCLATVCTILRGWPSSPLAWGMTPSWCRWTCYFSWGTGNRDVPYLPLLTRIWTERPSSLSTVAPPSLRSGYAWLWLQHTSQGLPLSHAQWVGTPRTCLPLPRTHTFQGSTSTCT